MIKHQDNEVEGVAVIGMAGRFPGCSNVEEYWKNLCDGVELISTFTDDELREANFSETFINQPNFIRRRGVLRNTEFFDASFFGLSAREAALMDPQHRVFLECAWEAFESGGYTPDDHEGRVGVFAGQSMNTYLLNNLYHHINLVESVESLQASIGNDKDSLTTEVAYRMNLNGPAVTIQSSSSTSLTAVHYACQSVLNYECEMALAGGVSIHYPENAGYLYHEGGTTAKDGHCRVFDADASGFVAGHGAGVVLLKRLSEAIEEGDTIWAVVRGSAVNNDGANKVSYMAPGVDGQTEAIVAAQTVAGIAADEIDYVEAHGTGTFVGDPIEVSALSQAFRESTEQTQYCILGSVKPNIGHLDSAAGIAGFIKAVLVLYHKKVPLTLHFKKPNPRIDFASSPFYVNNQIIEWEDKTQVYCAGVSSFGMGGTNAHVILQSPPPTTNTSNQAHEQLLVLSAKTETALETTTNNLLRFLEKNSDKSLTDIGYTLQKGRQAFSFRRFICAQTISHAVKILRQEVPEKIVSGVAEEGTQPMVFLFPGQGTQYINMGKGLYEQESVFREHLDECAVLLQKEGIQLMDLLYPTDDHDSQASEKLKQTHFSQLSLFSIEYSLAQLWRDKGVRPVAMIGHSIGEYVAACLAGVFSLKDALHIVNHRGRLMQSLETGQMVATILSEKQAEKYLKNDISLAAVNSNSNTVFSGPQDAIATLIHELEREKINYSLLQTSHAFHSVMIDPILEPFKQAFDSIELNPPLIPYISNVTGTWIKEEEVVQPDYWVKHARQTVLFSAGISELLRDPRVRFLEVGPGKVLSTFTREQVKQEKSVRIFDSLPHPKERIQDTTFFMNTMGKLWLSGFELSLFYNDQALKPRRIPLPTYPFEKQRYWIEPQQMRNTTDGFPNNKPQKLPIEEWYYLPSWKRSLPPKIDVQMETLVSPICLIFIDETTSALKSLTTKLRQFLHQQGWSLVTVSPGIELTQISASDYVLAPEKREDYETLIQTLKDLAKLPKKVIHLWSLQQVSSNDLSLSLQKGFYSLIFLTQALENCHLKDKVEITLITQSAWNISGNENMIPENTLGIAAAKVIQQEYRNFTFKCIDVHLPKPGSQQENKIARQIIAELLSTESEFSIALRGKQRWVPDFQPIALKPGGTGNLAPQREGIYLIIGGLGNVGALLAKTIAEMNKVTLVLIGRSPIPKPEYWEGWIRDHGEEDSISRKIRGVQSLKKLGATVHVMQADVTRQEQMQELVKTTQEQVGQIKGAFYSMGAVDRSLFQSLSAIRAEPHPHLHAKIKGLQVIKDVFQEQPLDFCVLFSSLASVLGGLGMAAYTASNMYLDAFAEQQNATSDTHWVSLNLDAFHLENSLYQTKENTSTEMAITAEDGEKMFQQILKAAPFSQVVISTYRLEQRLEQWIQSTPATEEVSEEPVNLAPRPALKDTYIAPRNPLEESISALWKDALGLEQVGVNDNFFDLGGNSLLGIKLIDEMKNKWNIGLSAVVLYESPTVESLSHFISSQLVEEEEEVDEFEQNRNRGKKRLEQMKKRRSLNKE